MRKIGFMASNEKPKPQTAPAPEPEPGAPDLTDEESQVLFAMVRTLANGSATPKQQVLIARVMALMAEKLAEAAPVMAEFDRARQSGARELVFRLVEIHEDEGDE